MSVIDGNLNSSFKLKQVSYVLFCFLSSETLKLEQYINKVQKYCKYFQDIPMTVCRSGLRQVLWDMDEETQRDTSKCRQSFLQSMAAVMYISGNNHIGSNNEKKLSVLKSHVKNTSTYIIIYYWQQTKKTSRINILRSTL